MKSIHNKAYQQLLRLLRSKRLDNGITQRELASRLGVCQGFVSKIETHERRLDVIELRDICNAMGISFRQFVIEFDDSLNQDKKDNEKD
ncbi:MAG: helix-turn-helix domain-containing protein [Muribaculaceae bacterium]|nr:helix-turn-helix domain-containing protein [Muribaculaceae bacterium]